MVSGVSGWLYWVDERSIGLTQRNNERLHATIKGRIDRGNTVVVVEHDEDAIRRADYVCDMGPGAGVHGVEIVAEGTLEQVLANTKSLTAAYLTGAKRIEVPKHRRKGNGFDLVLKDARANNLQNVTARIPLGTFTCVTGLSGSGKSRLIIDTLYASAARVLNGARMVAGPHARLKWLANLDKIND